MVTIIITTDVLFCGLCLYVVAMYKELQRVLMCNEQKSNVMLINNDNAHDHRGNIRDAIEFYLAIIR